MIQTLERFRPFKQLKTLLPKTLLGRALIILITPVLLAQGITTYVFLDRHLTKVTELLAQNISGSIAASLSLGEQAFSDPKKDGAFDLPAFVKQHFYLDLTFAKQTFLPPSTGSTGFLETYLSGHLKKKIPYPHEIQVGDPYTFVVVQTPQKPYHFSFLTKRLFSKTTEILLWWALGTPLLFLCIAVIFLRNQVRPLRRLSEVVEAFGKGQDEEKLHPSGAQEIRKVTETFNAMKARIRRQIEQRTHMLAGVSHDLRTPLARMSLQLAIMPQTEETQALQQDLKEMEALLVSYLAFARGEAAESPQKLTLGPFIKDVLRGATPQISSVSFEDEGLTFRARPNALKRCVTNLLQNGLRYAPSVWVSTCVVADELHIIIDDNGPGIPHEDRETVFKPFTRLEESRNVETGGTGLGLSIARDIARAHGGDVLLHTSPRGGLRATLTLPL